MIAASEIGPDGEVRFNRPPADQRFLEPYSGVYFQVSGEGADTFPSRSLWDRRLRVETAHNDVELHTYDSSEFAGEPLRIVERDVILPGSEVRWRFQVAQSREIIDGQIRELRSTLIRSFAALGARPARCSRRCRPSTACGRCAGCAARWSRSARASRPASAEDFPREIRPLVDEINQLLAHSEEQAEEARRHAGNLAHALKTPLTVITNAATADSPDLDDTVIREATVMRRQVDHHLARARAIGRRASAACPRHRLGQPGSGRARGRPPLSEASRSTSPATSTPQVRVERQDLDEMLGNLVENAAKYGSGRVFVTVEPVADKGVEILVEDDGPGIPPAERETIFARGARLDTTGKPGTGLGLAIVRDVAEIYGGRSGSRKARTSAACSPG